MVYYGQLVDAVYSAAKMRSTGWHGKLLVHTHVGEGSVIDYAPVPPAQPWTFESAFAAFPTTLSATPCKPNSIFRRCWARLRSSSAPIPTLAITSYSG
jgi:hypothetical protein